MKLGNRLIPERTQLEKEKEERKNKQRAAEEKRLAKESYELSFSNVAQQWIEDRESHDYWVNNIREPKCTIQILERNVYPFIGETHIEEISPEMVRAILEPIWQTKPSTAKKVKTYLRQIFQWGYRIKKEEGQRKSSTDGRNLRRPNGASAKKQERKTKLCVLSCKGYSSANVRDSFL